MRHTSDAQLLAHRPRLARGAYVYIIGAHPWSDCAGHYLGVVYDELLERYGARVLLDEGIEVMVWHRWQLRPLGQDEEE